MIGGLRRVADISSHVTRMFEMPDDVTRLDLTTKDLDLIEAALHTQQKILSVQSKAGGSGARQKLSDLRYLTQRVGRARPAPQPSASYSWIRAARCMIWPSGTCPQKQ
jgi:hypothetical protein